MSAEQKPTMLLVSLYTLNKQLEHAANSNTAGGRKPLQSPFRRHDLSTVLRTHGRWYEPLDCPESTFGTDLTIASL